MNSQVAVCGLIVTAMVVSTGTADTLTPTPLTEDDFRRIDTYIESELVEADIPGAALVIVEGKQIVHLRGYGVAGPDGRPVTAETGFYLGSVTKSFTALATMQLVEAGKIDLNASVQTYLPWFRVADAEASAKMKVRHLLNHTSGFSTYSGRTHLTSADVSAQAIAGRVRDLGHTELVAQVGETFHYSNANYCVLGAIIESVSGTRYEDFVQDHIFDPLDMTHSYTSEQTARQHDLATGYRYWFGHPQAVVDSPRSRGDLPAMSLISCARDMGHYLSAHMNGGVRHDIRILPDDRLAQLFLPERNSPNYAMGWNVRQIDGTRTLSHIGTTRNSQVGMAIFPEHNRGYALLINAQNQLSGPDVRALVDMTEIQMLGIIALPVAKAPSVHPSLGLLCLLLVGQIVGLTLDARQVRRWRAYPHGHRGKTWWSTLARGFVSVTLDVCVAVGVFWIVPAWFEVPLAGLVLYAPDAGWLLLLNGSLAVAGAVTSMGVAALHLCNNKDHVSSNAVN